MAGRAFDFSADTQTFEVVVIGFRQRVLHFSAGILNSFIDKSRVFSLSLTIMNTDTPETDEQINGKPCTRFAIAAGDSLQNALVPSEFARRLERERNAAREALRKARRFVEAFETCSRGAEVDQNETLNIISKVLEEIK